MERKRSQDGTRQDRTREGKTKTRQYREAVGKERDWGPIRRGGFTLLLGGDRLGYSPLDKTRQGNTSRGGFPEEVKLFMDKNDMDDRIALMIAR